MRLQHLLIPNVDKIYDDLKQNQVAFQYVIWEQLCRNIKELYYDFSEPIVCFYSPQKQIKELFQLYREGDIYIHSIGCNLYNSESENIKTLYDFSVFSKQDIAKKIIKENSLVDEKSKDRVLKCETRMILYHIRFEIIGLSVQEYCYHSPIIYLKQFYSQKDIDMIQNFIDDFRIKTMEEISLSRREI
ncbi:MAG: hypothetical protein NZM44_05150 [Candidatus Calescibacterium sp.]|nr:hypothetical protein [Candidatus Calescibacterium sp.]